MSGSPCAEVLAVDIGGTTTKIALVNQGGVIRRHSSLPTSGPDAMRFLHTLAHRLHALLAAEAAATGISVAVAGFAGNGTLTYNPNLPWLEHAPITATLADRTGLPVTLESDANAACAGEYVFGEGAGASRLLCIVGGTGLGVGMIADGTLVRLAHGCMGDAGHIIVAPDGAKCSCGGKGCAEAYIATAALGSRYGRLLGKPATFATLLQDRAEERIEALVFLRESGHWLGIVAASLANMVFPDRIVVAGGLAHAGEAFFSAARRSFSSHAGEYIRKQVCLLPSTKREHATLLGAAACFFQPEIARANALPLEP